MQLRWLYAHGYLKVTDLVFLSGFIVSFNTRDYLYQNQNCLTKKPLLAY